MLVQLGLCQSWSETLKPGLNFIASISGPYFSHHSPYFTVGVIEQNDKDKVASKDSVTRINLFFMFKVLK